ncbi:MAG: biotin--[Paludibacteraceae bacterium]|jgi:BirA family biotin operon repressor/biotin-[acetyl-CoA-carboxylase] ligase|nr:biotin--[acetyl-CoA-carboxylase] ligase [Paludibacteraceae bacterium]
MYISTTNSTNTLMKELLAKGEWQEGERFLYTAFQTAGRGQAGNGWESEEGKNLLCSILLPPNKNLYFLNIAIGVALLRVIGEDFTIKWPNDIYFGDKKVAGILIENAIIGNEIKYSIAGIGLNVNQTTFVSDAPNPVSLKQIRGQEYDIERLMNHLFETVQRVLNESEQEVWAYYKSHLYRREGFWPFEDKDGPFEAAIKDVLPTGEIVLEDKKGQERIYHFKQVRYVI